MRFKKKTINPECVCCSMCLNPDYIQELSVNAALSEKCDVDFELIKLNVFRTPNDRVYWHFIDTASADEWNDFVQGFIIWEAFLNFKTEVDRVRELRKSLPEKDVGRTELNAIYQRCQAASNRRWGSAVGKRSIFWKEYRRVSRDRVKRVRKRHRESSAAESSANASAISGYDGDDERGRGKEKKKRVVQQEAFDSVAYQPSVNDSVGGQDPGDDASG